MNKPASLAELTALGRVRLSEHFFMREMLCSEVANFHGMQNIPDHPDLAIEAGSKLCQLLLEPLHRAFGAVAIRSAYRSPSVNAFCNERFALGDTAYFCSENEFNYARHIWDYRDAARFLGATASLVVPGYLAHFERTQDYRPLAWWIRDHVEGYAELAFYPWLCAFNIRWYEGPSERRITYSDPPYREILTEEGMANFAGDHSAAYRQLV
jgi:hypothetical protein